MAENLDKTKGNDWNVLKLLQDNEAAEYLGEAAASFLVSPAVAWAKFILLDDQPNGNKHRIPVEEFDNVISTALHMPVKMAEGRIRDGHELAKPIGAIAHLKKELVDGVNRIVALAALWKNERPDDVRYLKDMMDSGKEVNVSWELSFGDVKASEGGAIDLRDITMKAATIVGTPAYKGRTKFLAIAAAKKWSKAYIEQLPDSSFLLVERGKEDNSDGAVASTSTLRYFPFKDTEGRIDEERLRVISKELLSSGLPEETLTAVRNTVSSFIGKLDAGASIDTLSFGDAYTPKENNKLEDVTLETLDELKAKLDEATVQLSAALSQLKEREEELGKIKETFASVEQSKVDMEAELNTLREFKSGIDEVKIKEEKLASIKSKFAEAGIEKDEEYFKSNNEMLAKLGDGELSFLVQELSAFSKNAEASQKGKVPGNLSLDAGSVISVAEIAKALKERKAK